ncbi:hypothetical protein PG995_010914 [Apiospora arundinis]
MFQSPSISSQTTHLLRHCSRELPHLRLSPIRSFVSASGAGHKSNPSRRQSRLISYKMADSQDATQKDFLQRPPYQAADPAAFDKKLQGSCHCGRVKYWLSREQPLNAKFCHCRGCQVLHGSPFQWAAIFHKEDMMFEKGAEDLVFYQSESRHLSHDLPCKASCSYCRTPIMDEGRNMVLLFPTLIKFTGKKERDLFSPKCHIFYSQRVVDIPDGQPKWEGLDGEGKSKLLDDLP